MQIPRIHLMIRKETIYNKTEQGQIELPNKQVQFKNLKNRKYTSTWKIKPIQWYDMNPQTVKTNNSSVI